MILNSIINELKSITNSVDSTSIYTVIVTAVSVLGSTGAWKYYEKKAVIKDEQEREIKNDCNERIEKLEILLNKSSDEKDILRNQLLKLVEQVSALKVKVEFLEKENKELIKNKK